MHNKAKVIQINDNHNPDQNEFYELYLDDPRYTVVVEEITSTYTNQPKKTRVFHTNDLSGYVLGKIINLFGELN